MDRFARGTLVLVACFALLVAPTWAASPTSTSPSNTPALGAAVGQYVAGNTPALVIGETDASAKAIELAVFDNLLVNNVFLPGTLATTGLVGLGGNTPALAASPSTALLKA